MSRRELGEILREADLITESQLAQALHLQRAYGERLASVLVRQRILTEKFAVTYLGRQVGVPAVDLSKQEIDLGLLDLVPLRLCERHMIFPVKVDGTRLQIAMSDPSDQLLVAEIETKTGVRLQPMIALEASVKNAILEARRALRDGRRLIQPNVLRARDADDYATPMAPFPAAPGAETPAPSTPLPVAPLQPSELTVVESLAGTLLKAPAAAPGGPRPWPGPASPPAPDAQAPPPAAPEPAPPAHARQPRPSHPAHTPPTPLPFPPPAVEGRHALANVLVVDDDEMILHLLTQLLEGADMRVSTARSGREALAQLRHATPDLVVLDGMLPEVHGFEICRQIKNSERFRHVPVVLVSAVHRGWRFAADVQERYGADAYVEKPFEPFDLLRRIEMLLKRVPPPEPESEEQIKLSLKAGVAALKQGQLEQAVQAFEKGLDAGPTNELLHYYLGMTYEKRGMVFHAIDHYEQAVQASPGFYDAIVSLATLYEQHQFRLKAAEMWERALRASSDETVRQRIKEHLVGLL
jgi:DNA-binding response OmpR family regulator